MRSIRSVKAAAVWLITLWLGVGMMEGAQQAARERLPNFDKRQEQRGASKNAPHARVAEAKRVVSIVPGARVEFDPVSGGPKWVGSTSGFLTGPEGKGLSAAALAAAGPQDPQRVTKAFIREHQDLFGHGPEALSAARVTRDYDTPHNGMKTVVWQQQLDDIPVFEATFISHTTRNGELVSVSSTFLSDPAAAAEAGTPGRSAVKTAPPVSARRALSLAAENLGDSLKETEVTEKAPEPGAEHKQQLRAPGLKGDSEASLAWFPLNSGNLRLCWDLVVTSRARDEMFMILVDAQTGEVLFRRCLTAYISDASYRVFTSDSPSPFSPGYPTPVTNQPPLVSRALVTLPALDTNASPAGWINDGVNETIGNNVDAHTDRNADNSPDLPRPQGSPFRVFDFAMDLSTQDPTNYGPAAVTQLFYWCNWYHDRLYQLGFTEAAGNFQSNNFGRGGFGNDAVQADAQDGSGVNNANFSTPPDGSPGRMQMYVFTSMSPRRDGDLDAEIVMHEHTHGLSWRLVGGGQALGDTQSDGMGEGWSDFYGLTLLSEAGDDVNGNYAAGAYASYKIGGSTDLQNYYFGIRRYPYTTAMARNPLTFNDIDPGQADYCASPAPYHTGMFGSCSTASASEVHNEGEVWCVTLWEARANLINRYGWAIGNQLILQLVTDGMKLTAPHPNFLQARDGILQADLVDTGGANRNELWAAFAKRGMGFSATSPASSSASGVHETFDLPDDLRITPGTGFTASGPVGGPFNPTSTSFSLTNAGSNSLSWVAANSNLWLNVSPTSGTSTPGSPATTVTASLNGNAASLPMGIYNGGVVFSNLNSSVATVRNFALRVGQPDFFTELFDTSANDLAFQTLTFTPNGSASYYSACREVAGTFPTDPAGGTTVALSDDSYIQITLSGTNTVAIYNRRTNVFFIGSNGYLTMNSGDDSLGESFASHFSLPRVSACFDDLNPSAGGTVSWKQTTDLVAVTFSSVREFGTAAIVSFQIEMFYDGRIRITYLGIGITDGLAGLSAGTGVPVGFLESDLGTYGPCAPPDDLAVAPSTGFSSQGYQGGPFSPPSTTYAISNSGTNTVAWSITRNQPWIGISATNGSLAASGSSNIVVSINSAANSLAPGSYNGIVTFSNLNSGFAQSRAVSLLVLAIPGEIVISDSIPPTLDLQMPFGNVIAGLSRVEHITISNSDAIYGLAISNISFGQFVEDFNDGAAQNWVETTDPYWNVVGGEYRAQAGALSTYMQSFYFGQVWQDCAAQVTARRTGDTANAAVLVVRATDNFNWGTSAGSAYLLGIDGTGFYYVAKYVAGVFTFLQSWTASPYLTAGTNTIVASIQGSAIRVYFNGALGWTGTDNGITAAGRVGLMGYSGSTTETVDFFDNVIVGDPLTSLAIVGTTQASLNAHPFAGGTAGTRLANAPPGGGAGGPQSEGKDIQELSLTSGPWRLDNVPSLPYIVPPSGSLTLDVTYQPATPGSNYAKVVITSNDANEPSSEVELTAQAILDYLQVQPASDFASQGHPGGPFSPPSASYVLSNSGPTTINWTTSHTQAWITVSPPSGTLSAGQAGTVTVGFAAAANSLTVGTYYDTVRFSNITTTVSQPRNVSLTVFTSPQIVVTPSSMAVTNVLGGSTNVTLLVSNALSADGNLNFNINAVETGRILDLAAAGVGLPPSDRDFTTAAPDKEYSADGLLVRFAVGVQGAQQSQILASLGGAKVEREYKLVPGLVLVKLPEGLTVSQALRTFNGTPGILYAEPNYQVKALSTFPNDARFSELWGMHNTGQTGGTPDADIDAPEAWDLNQGSRQVRVAVIDTGVDYTHPDLTNNIWTNPGEIPGNGIDDDGNGFVDDVHGYDFVNSDGNPMDDHYHGTHCAGTIGAEGNNGIGVAGVCWQARIMAVKFLDASGSGSTANAISAVQYATLMGARVMNNSWGGGAFSQALKDAIDAAGAAGSVFVAAAGNNSSNNDTTPSYPASYSSANIVSVMSTDHNDVRSDFSNYGLTNVDLAAPGSSILSCQPGGLYQKLSGTSMATPHVSGACALLLSANPLLSVAQVKQALLSTVDPTVPGQCVSGGRLNLSRALASVGAAWITVTPAGGTNVVPGGPVNVTVNFQAGELPSGLYSGQLVISCNDLITPSVTVPVSMRVLPENLQVTPTSVFASAGAQGGPFNPSANVYVLTNAGAVPISWQAVHTQSWVTVSPGSGTLPGGGSLLVTGSINSAANLLTPGSYGDNLVFSNTVSHAVRRRAFALSVMIPGLSISDASVLEGDSGQTNIVFPVRLSPPSSQTVTVSYATSIGTAQAGSDYSTTNGLLTFAPLQTNATISAAVFGDTNAEPNETFFVNLSSPVNASLVVSQAVGTIITDDGLTLAQALDTPGWLWVTGGATNWFGQSTNTHDGIDAAKSGTITHLQEIWMQTTVQGPGVLTFWWSVSSESGYDYLEFYTNGLLVTRISGSLGWSFMSNRIASGTQTLRWRYAKDGSVNSGLDSGWVDQVSLVPDDSLSVQPGDGLVSSGIQGGPFSPTNKLYSLSNYGTSNLTWSATSTQPWVTVGPLTGSLAASAATNVLVSLNANALTLSNGVYSASVVFSNLLTGVAQTRPVQLIVSAPPQPPVVPLGPIPTNLATGVSVHTLLSWNNPNSGLLAQGLSGSFGVLDTAGFDAEAIAQVQSLPGLTASLVPWSVISSSSGAALYSSYDTIYLPVNSGITDYQNLRTAVATGQSLEQFVSLGGTLVLNVAGNNGNQADIGPGGLDYDRTFTHDADTIVSASHPFITGAGYGGSSLTAAIFNTWNNTDHGTLTGAPAGAVGVLQNADGTSMLEYEWGAGRVVASTLTFGWAGATIRFGPPFSNELLYAASRIDLASNATYFVRLGTNPASLNLIAANLTQPTCNPGPLAFDNSYYWQVVASNALGSVTGAVWTFTTTLDEVHFASATSSVLENGGSAIITVVRENPAGGVLSVPYSTTNGTATAGVDYTNVSGTLTFPAGVLSTNFQVPILDDAQAEGDETVLLRLGQPAGNVLLSTPSSAALTIVDNDGQIVTLPYNLYDNFPYLWDIDNNGEIIDGTSDAYDGGLVLSNFPSLTTALLVGGREVVIGPATQGGLEITRRIYVPANHSYARFLEVLRNPGASPITTTVRLDTDLGSDSSTVVVGTSSGDTLFTTSDNWIVTDDTDGSGDPTVLHVIANDWGTLRPSAVYYTTGALGYQYAVTVPAGETRIVVHFAAQSPNRATALAKAPELVRLGQDALTQISPQDQARIVNFGFEPRPVMTWLYDPGSHSYTLSWSGTGFHLQAQTNSAGGLTTNWYDYPGGTSSPLIIPVNPAHKSVFYRLLRP